MSNCYSQLLIGSRRIHIKHVEHFSMVKCINSQVFNISVCIRMNRAKEEGTRLHSSRMRTARSSRCPGGVSPPDTPGSRTPLGPGTPPPGPGTPPEQTPQDQASPQSRPLRAGNQPHPPWSGHLPPVNRMTDRCKNITLLQTSFAGGNYWCLHPQSRD